MAVNEHMINRNADDGKLICRSAECLQELPTDGGYLCSNPIFTFHIFTTYDSSHGRKSILQKWLDKLRHI